MRTALYARVSTERQERQQTIESQLAALRAWAVAGGHALAEEHVFRDEGYSGGRLDRPGLDALRDAVRDGAVECVAVLSPDRLARRYAYQVILLEEFRRVSCQVTFLHHPISDDPNDQLLLQIQGAIAEYERAVLGERFRRGKLQRARDGHYLGGRSPYGYRYVPRHNATPGYLAVDDNEAELVRTLYGWLTDERMTIRQILKRLNTGPYLPRSGRHAWSPSTVHHILADPIYTGTAYANRYSYVPAAKPRCTGAHRSPRTGAATCRRLRPREQWIAIPVPALIDTDTWDRAQAQLARNAELSFRNNSRHNYLLRCLLTCEVCGLAMYGITRPATAHQPQRQYYECRGKDCILSARTAVCPSRSVRATDIEATLWEHVAVLLADPEQLLAQFGQFAAAAEAGTAQDRAAEQLLHTRLDRVARADKRLLDAYQIGAVSLPELTERRQHLAEERRGLERQREERLRLRQQRTQAEVVRTDVAAFCARIRTRLDRATAAEKQAILQLVVERVIVGNGRLEIHHVVPLRPLQPGNDGPVLSAERLRSDRVHRAALGRHIGPQRGQGAFQSGGSVDDQEFGCAQATTDQIIKDAAPRRFALTPHVLHRQEHLLPVAAYAQHDQQRYGGRFPIEPDPHDRAIQDQPDDVLLGQITPVPGIPVSADLAPRPADHVFAHSPAKQRSQGPFDPAGVGSRQVGSRDQRLDLAGHAGIARQDGAMPFPRAAVLHGQSGSWDIDPHRPERAEQLAIACAVAIALRP
jgi:site-specific DNA recombinase